MFGLADLFTGFINLLAENPLLLLFTIIGLGYLIGNIKIFGFNLGIAAVLLIGMGAGAIDNRLNLPEYIYILGLVIFVYALGLQAGPGFFSSFQKRGVRFSLIAVAVLTGAALLAALLGNILGMSAPSIAGLFCGSLTNTPALAAAVEAVKGLSGSIPPELRETYINSPVVTYGVSYLFGVFGVILWFFIFSKIFKVDYAKEAADRSSSEAPEEIISQTYKITNPAVNGKTIDEAFQLLGSPGFVLSRIKHGEEVFIAAPDKTLLMGDLVVAVGTQTSLVRAHVLFGEVSSEQVAQRRDDTAYTQLFVSNKAVVGKSIRELRAEHHFEGAITRLNRSGVEFVTTPDTILEMGDRILVVVARQQKEQITKLFGDSVQSLSETDFLSLSLGIVLGVFVGMIPFPLPGGGIFRLGFAGGPLVVGLILGRLERTGPIQWGLPHAANLVLRQIGLVLFLAAIGTKAGYGFGATFQAGSWGLFLAGGLITSFTTIATILIGYKYLKLPMLGVMGMMSGIQTQPACLAYANQQAKSDLPNVWYATVQPASMIAKIMLAQIIVTTLIL
ncbi:MAG: transporter [bacterium]|nr:transporter [bacterium]